MQVLENISTKLLWYNQLPPTRSLLRLGKYTPPVSVVDPTVVVGTDTQGSPWWSKQQMVYSRLALPVAVYQLLYPQFEPAVVRHENIPSLSWLLNLQREG